MNTFKTILSVSIKTALVVWLLSVVYFGLVNTFTPDQSYDTSNVSVQHDGKLHNRAMGSVTVTHADIDFNEAEHQIHMPIVLDNGYFARVYLVDDLGGNDSGHIGGLVREWGTYSVVAYRLDTLTHGIIAHEAKHVAVDYLKFVHPNGCVNPAGEPTYCEELEAYAIEEVVNQTMESGKIREQLEYNRTSVARQKAELERQVAQLQALINRIKNVN